MRILLADDEQIVLDGLTRIIAQYDPAFRVQTAKTGREAIQVAEAFHPDLVFMDIKMPGIGGLEALEEIHRQFPQTILVILSAYEQFEFARTAIRLQVLDYMVKPITKDRLIDVLKRAQSLLDERQAERSHILELREKYQKLIPFFEHDLIFRIIAGMDPEESLAFYRDLLHLPDGLYTFMLLQLQCQGEDSGDDPWGSEYQIHQHLLHLSEAIRLKFSALTGPVSTNPLAFLLPLKEKDEYQARLESVALADSILRMVPPELNAAIGIGKAYAFPTGISRSYQEALMALGRRQLGAIRHFMDLFGVDEPDWELQFNEVETQILQAVEQGQTDSIRELLPHKLLALAHLFPDELQRIHRRCRELEILALRQARQHGYRSDHDAIDPPEITKESFQQAYLPHLQGLLCTWARFIRENKTERLNTIVSSAKSYIDQAYANEGLNLEEVARQVCVTPYYLSRLFHAEMGMTFTDYLTKTRLEKAVELLQSGVSVKEICYQVGYADPNYFSRLFRKVFGVPPTEYRKGS